MIYCNLKGGLGNMIFQIAATKGGSNIHIVNEPLRTQSGSPVVFLVETGEGRTRPETRFSYCYK